MSHKRTAKFVTSTCNTTTIAGIAKKQKLTKLIDCQAVADLGRIAFPPSVCAPITHSSLTSSGDVRALPTLLWLMSASFGSPLPKHMSDKTPR